MMPGRPLIHSAQILLAIVGLCLTLTARAQEAPASENRIGDWFTSQWQKWRGAELPQDYQPSFTIKGQVQKPQYIVGIHPLHNPKLLFEIYGPIIDYLNARMPEVDLKLEASRNYEDFNQKLFAEHFAFAMPNPYQTLRALDHGYRVFGKMADDDSFRGIILVRQDSQISSFADLKGKKIAFPAPTALAATILNQYLLQQNGIDINHDIENLYVGSQESSISNVVMGRVAAAGTWPVPWASFSNDHPEQAAQLKVMWQTEHMVNNGWVVSNQVPEPVAAAFARHLLSMQEDEVGRKLLQAVPVSRFEAANDATFLPTKAFIDRFNRTVRRIDD